jgi:guanosine-3',5'-bis(diphosphate) 3'-pyrophosphohydrolase
MPAERPPVDDDAHLIERAIEICLTAHAGQRDRSGQPYFMHCLRVMMSVSEDPAQRIVALLHAVAETGAVPLRRLRLEGFSPRIVAAIDALTRRPGESALEAAARARAHPLARAVAVAANTHETRQCLLPDASRTDRARLPEFRAVRAFLLQFSEPASGETGA